MTSYANLEKPEQFTGAFVASIRVLYDKLDFGFIHAGGDPEPFGIYG